MKVFISHANDGSEAARALAASLRREGFQVWLAQEEILPGDNWAEAVSQALKESQAMVVLFTPEALAASNVRWEVGFALGSPNYRDHVIPVLLGPILPEAIPGVLRRYALQLKEMDPNQVNRVVREIMSALLAPA
jgi:hypothetical protein